MIGPLLPIFPYFPGEDDKQPLQLDFFVPASTPPPKGVSLKPL